jgi:hypothetical protein
MASVIARGTVASGGPIAYHSPFAIHQSANLARRIRMFDPSKALTLQFLAWVAEAPRSYADAMEAWRSTCPRLSIWEDAILEGLIAFDGARTRNQSRVALTDKGRAWLRASEPSAPAPRIGELVR